MENGNNEKNNSSQLHKQLYQARAELEISRKKYADLYDFAPVGYFTLSTAGIILKANLKLTDMLEKDRECLVDQPFSKFVVAEDVDRYNMHCREVIETRQQQECELRIKGKKGSVFWGYAQCRPVLGQDGQVIRIRSALTDITEHKRAQTDLQKAYNNLENSEQFLRSIVETATSAIVSADKAGNIIFWNHKAEKIFGYPAEEILNKPLTTIMPERYHETHRKEYKRVFETGKSRIKDSGIELFGLKKDGNEVALEIFISKWQAEDDIFFTAVINDITGRKRTEKALHDTETRFRYTFNQAYQFSDLIDLQGNLMEANDLCFRETGLTKEQVIGLPFHEVPWWKDDRDMRKGILEDIKTAVNGNIARREAVYLNKKKEERLADINISPIYDDDGKIIFILAQGIDITERKKAEKALHKAEARFRYTFNQTYQFCVLIDLQGNLMEANDLCFKESGLTEEQVVGLPFHEVPWWKDDLDMRKGILEDMKAAVNGNIARREAVYLNKKKEERTADINMSPVYDDDGEIIFILGQGIDITDRKLAREALLESEKRLRLIADYTYDWESWLAPDGRLMWLNPAVEKLTGYSVQDCKKMSGYPLSIVYEDDRPALEDLLKRALNEQTSLNDVEFRICSKTGLVEWMAISWQPIYDDRGRYIGQRTSVRDISERRRAEKERERLLKTLEFKNRELQDIVYTASHDLKSPLVNIEGFSGELKSICSDLLELFTEQGSGENKKARIDLLLEREIPQSLGFITASTKKMSGLLNGLLRVSRIGAVEIKKQSLDMNSIVSEVLKALEYQLKESSSAVTVDLLPGCTGDPYMLDDIFTNLISNAIKYRDPTKRGKIHISGRIEAGMSIYCVEDNGIGIAPEYQKKIFEIFHRLNPHNSGGGEGLGLTIIKRILDRLGGRIWLESEPGKGCKFFICLPNASQH